MRQRKKRDILPFSPLEFNYWRAFRLALTLFVPGVTADHTYHTIAANNLAVTTHLFNGCTNFHLKTPERTLSALLIALRQHGHDRADWLFAAHCRTGETSDAPAPAP